MWPQPPARPVESLKMSAEHAEWRPADIRSFSHCQFAIEIGREKDGLRIRIEQDLLRIEAMNVGDSLSRNGISVITTLTNIFDWHSAMPNPSGLVAQKIEAVEEQRVHQIARSIEQ